jgi:hypothetical protein
LKEFCKIYKGNKKTEKEKKRKEEIKMEKGPGEPFSPTEKGACGPTIESRNGIPLPLFLSLTLGPTCQLTRSSSSSR